MAKNVNTTESIKEAKTDGDLNAEMAVLNKELQEEEKVDVLIPKVYQKRIGQDYLPIGINGVFINIPLGKTVPIPKSYKQLVDEFLEFTTL
ncbi:hypothetical protein [Bacillus thuringiensis]|uniref:hypothetical protein n=1 Tax=Bacillus thuringiensis TaxID=1428 RepID=UPI000BF9002A|nr:hypothetical protein [Bacillus thuringiensis]PFD30369.1 hypothetical protein CN278_25730 [Bacillus thuringiensis]